MEHGRADQNLPLKSAKRNTVIEWQPQFIEREPQRSGPVPANASQTPPRWAWEMEKGNYNRKFVVRSDKLTVLKHGHIFLTKGSMPKTVSEKMGIKPAVRAILINAPADAVPAMALPALTQALRLTGQFDYIHFFALNQAQLDQKFDQLREHLNATGMLWVSWPKERKLGTDLTIKHVIRIGYDHGLVESKALSINHTWSALKFTHPKAGKVYKNSFGRLSQRAPIG